MVRNDTFLGSLNTEVDVVVRPSPAVYKEYLTARACQLWVVHILYVKLIIEIRQVRKWTRVVIYACWYAASARKELWDIGYWLNLARL